MVIVLHLKMVRYAIAIHIYLEMIRYHVVIGIIELMSDVVMP